MQNGDGRYPPGRSLPALPSMRPTTTNAVPAPTNTLNCHPQGRPLPGPPSEDVSQQEDPFSELMDEVDAAIPRLDRPSRSSTQSNGRPGPIRREADYDYSDHESIAEDMAGMALLRMDEEREAREDRDRRERENSSASATSFANSCGGEDAEEDEDEEAYDLSQLSGGYNADVHYGGRLHSVDTTPVSADGVEDWAGFSWGSSYGVYPTTARVDAGGTGGLAEPDSLGRRKLSFEDADEGDSPLATTPEQPRSDDDDADEDSYELRDPFFHPGMRPLPPAPVQPARNRQLQQHLMPAGTYRDRQHGQDNYYEFARYSPGLPPTSPDSFGRTLPSPSHMPRSTSLFNQPIRRAETPIRSKTDTSRERSIQRELEVVPPAGALDLPDIPAGRRKKINLSKLSSQQFKKCKEPWALSALLEWVRDICEDEVDLRESVISDALVSLFTHKVPTMNVADAETLGALVVEDMLAEQALVKEEEWVKFSGSGSTMSGVLFQITGKGCYSPRLHASDMTTPGRCYSHHCMRTLRKVDLKTQNLAPERQAEDWVTFYQVPKETWSSYPGKEIARQNNLHEIVTTEDSYIGQLDVLRTLYRDQLAAKQPPIMTGKRLERFLKEVFGHVDSVKRVNEEFLLAQLKYRQKEQGPFIVGFSDIFREWIRKAKLEYVRYAEAFPNANYQMRKEVERNMRFRDFLNKVRDDKGSNRLGWDTYLKSPITRIQRYTLLLATVHKNMLRDSEEKRNLSQAIEEIKQVALDCDHKVGEMNKKVDLLELSQKLQLRPEMKKEVELNLQHLGREIVFRGDLQRPGTRTRFNLVDTHAILFDHYLVLAKESTARDPTKSFRYATYDVSKLPIPMDLLVLESSNDDPIARSAVRGVASMAPSPVVSLVAEHANQAAANGTLPNSVAESTNDRLLYPFRIKHLGKSPAYTLYASSAKNRQEWCQHIIDAKARHAKALFEQNAEPFRLRVLADAAFGYSELQPSGSVLIAGSPIHRAIEEVEREYPKTNIPPRVVCRNDVNCATVFQHASGRMICAVGTDFGVFISPYENARGWFRVCLVISNSFFFFFFYWERLYLAG